MKSREEIITIGSSMFRNVEKIICMKDEGSYLWSIWGVGIKQIMSETVVAVEVA